MKQCLVIINPVAGGGKPTSYAMGLQWQLSQMYDRLEVKFTRKEGDAIEFAKQATEAGFDAVFCLGGDGTVNETVNGIVQGGGGAAFGFVPVGTVNDMARALGIPLQPQNAINMLADSEELAVDIGRCNDKYFCNNIAVGVLPKVVEEVTPKEKALLGPLAYFLRGSQAILTTKNIDFVIDMPYRNETLYVKSPLVLALMTNCVSSFEKFMPAAEVNDGYMRLVVFKEYAVTDVIKIVPLLLSGKLSQSKQVKILKTKKVKIYANSDELLPTNMDGSRGPDVPVELEVLPQFLKVIVPRKRKKKQNPFLELGKMFKFEMPEFSKEELKKLLKGKD